MRMRMRMILIRVGGEKLSREKRAMAAVRRSPGDVYAVVGYLDGFGCDGCGYVGCAMQFLLS